MVRIIFLMLPYVLVFSCKSDTSETPAKKELAKTASPIQASHLAISQVDSFDLEQHVLDYKAMKRRIANRLRSNLSKANYRQQAPQDFVNILVDSLFPYWYGTPWDFNGYTETPRKGNIACGYFVSTTLRDMGLKINRYKIAQKAALGILKTFVKPENILSFQEFDRMHAYLATSQKDEVFILGLDYHVGFVVRKDQQLYFIHSNYFGKSQVEKEAFTASYSAQSSARFYLGSLTNNQVFINRWISSRH